MRIYAYFLSFLLIFAPAYAYAIFPAIGAIAASTAGRVAVSTGTGVVLKKVAPNALQKIAKAAVAICQKNKTAFAFCSAVTTAMVSDGIDIDVNIDNSDTNNVDVDIYKREVDENICALSFYYRLLDGEYVPYPPAEYFYENVFMPRMKTLYTQFDVNTFKSTQAGYDILQEYVNQATVSIDKTGRVVRNDYKLTNYYINLPFTYVYSGQIREQSYQVKLYYKCTQNFSDGKKYLSDDDIYQYFIDNVSDDDITNIYNYDFSKHYEIEINNNSDTGDNVNKQKDVEDPNEPQKKVSDDAAKKMKDKEDDYHPDKINDENCDKNENGEYDECGADREDNPDDNCPSGYVQYNGNCIKKDDDDTANKECPAGTVSVNNGTCIKPEENDEIDPEEDRPAACDSNEFYKKVCDWIDWTQEDYEPDEDTKPDIKDATEDLELKEDRIKFNAECPPPKQITISAGGRTISLNWSYQQWCDSFIDLKPYLIGLSSISSVLIITGVRKNG